MDLLNSIKAADTAAFKFINITLYNGFMAMLMKITANDIFLIVLVAAGLFYLSRAGGLKFRINIAFSLWAIIITNVVCNGVLKGIFNRPRPFLTIAGAHLLVALKNNGLAFPSTHTAMASAFAAVLWEDYPRARPWLCLFVFFVGFFCVYTGGHYPGDVLAGLVVGIVLGGLMAKMKGYFALSQKSKLKSQK